MELTEALLEQMDLYLKGELDAEAMAAFESRLESDQAFAREYYLFRISTAVAKLDGKEADREKLKAIEERLKKKDSKGKPPWRILGISFLAVAAGLLVFFSFLMNKENEVSTATLYAEYFEPEPDLITTMSGNSGAKLLIEAMAFYNQSNYDSATYVFEQLADSIRLKPLPLIYNGISLMESGRPEAGQVCFETVLSMDSLEGQESAFQSLQSKAAWFLGLLQLKFGRVAAADSAFQEASKLDPAYLERVKTIRSDLKKLK